MKKQYTKRHLESSLIIMEKALEILKAELKELRPSMEENVIDNVGKYVKKELEIMELEEKIKKIKEELKN